jgi:chaperonin GroEL (HSP60 family)
MMAENSYILDLKDVCHICKTLEQIICHSIGPRGSKTLLATETGQVIITSDGRAVLRKLHFSHPIAKLIIDSMTKTVNFTGDGSKTFILYLSQFIKQLDNFEHRRNCYGRNSYVSALQKIKQKITDELFPYMQSKMPEMVQCFSAEILGKILKTCLSNFFPFRIVDHYVSLMNDVICVDPHHFKEHIQNISDNFEQICVKIPNLPFAESKTMPGFIIRRKFAVYNKNSLTENLKFLICMFSVTGHPKNLETREIIKLKSEFAMIKFMDHHKLLLTSFVEMCLSNNVNLIICAEQVSDQALYLLESSGISVIHFVPEEDCQWLLANLKMSPCISILEKFESNMFYKANSCKPLIINGRQCIHLDLKSVLQLPKMLLICAPTEGLCNQVSVNLQKSLKSLLVCFSSDHCDSLSEPIDDRKEKLTIGKVAVVGGGGTFEFLASDFLLDLEVKFQDCECVNLMCKLLSEALLQLPKVLFQNNSPSKEINLKRYFLSLEEIGKSKCCKKYLGFNRNGAVSDLFSDGILESVVMKIHVLLSVIELIQQMLRVDAVIGVKRIIQDD